MKKSLSVLVAIAALLSGCTKVSDPTPVEKTGIVKECLNISPDFFGVDFGPLSAGEASKAGSAVTLKLSAGEILSDGFQDLHLEHIYVHVGNSVYHPVFPEGASAGSKTVEVSITIPEGDYDVYTCYSAQQHLKADGYAIQLASADAGVKILGADPDAKYDYFDCYVLVPDAYTVSGMEFKVGNGSWNNVNNITGCSYGRLYNCDRAYSLTIRPDYKDVNGEVSVNVKGNQLTRHSIKWEGADAKYLDLEKTLLPTEAIAGDRVATELYINDSYYLSKVSSSVAGHEIEVFSGYGIAFTMPAADVTVSLTFAEEMALVAQKGAHVTSAVFYNANDVYYGVPVTTGAPGERVYLFCEAERGYKPSSVSVLGGTCTFEYYAPGMYMSEIVLPDEPTTVTATANAEVAYTVGASSDIYLPNGSLYCAGETVPFTVSVPGGKAVDDVCIIAADGSEVSCSFNSPYGTFVMPAQNVAISVTFADLGGDNVTVTAEFDDESFRVYSSTDYNWDFAEGFTIVKGSTFYLSVLEYYGLMFYVNVTVGDNSTTYPATEDEESGEYTFGKAIVADGDVHIKVGYKNFE